MGKKKREPPTLEAMQRQIDDLQARIAAQSPPAAPETTLTELRRRLKAHRTEMRQAPGGIIALDDERTEALLLRAIEIAKAPHSATVSHTDGLERMDGLTNDGLSGGDEEENE